MTDETVEPQQARSLSESGTSSLPGEVFDESEPVSLWVWTDIGPEATSPIWRVTTQPLTAGAPPKSCTDSEVLIIAGAAVTDGEGVRELSVNDFWCKPEGNFTILFQRPEILLATAGGDQPAYMTTETIWPDTRDDLTLRFFSWGVGGRHAPEVVFRWSLTVGVTFSPG